MTKRSLVLIAILWLVVLAAGISSALTIHFTGADQGWDVGLPVSKGVYVSEEEYSTLQSYAQLDEIRRIVLDQYYTEVDEEALLTGAMRGMLDALEDRYSFYYTAQEMQEFVESASGEYKGVGMTMSIDGEGNLAIVRVFSGGPAHRAGIQDGDNLLFVNEQRVSGETAETLNEALRLIEECGDEEFTLTLRRGNEIYSVRLRRENVVINNVEYALLDGGIGYVQILEFMGNDVDGFLEAMTSFADAPLQGLIIDLRGNTGGILSDAVDIADFLLPEGLIVYTEDRHGTRREERSDASCVEYPVVCLVDGMSASASEVLAGAVQDHGVGAIIGEKTFGKGIVQTVYNLADGTGMQITTETYFTPAGRSIHGEGLQPDHEISDDPATEIDEVLEYACKWLLENDK
ncbi:MAG: S41 family peptidase [Eubacteriales bacterium]|nr:S41 family peptidase [Eubacteriales bacterium]